MFQQLLYFFLSFLCFLGIIMGGFIKIIEFQELANWKVWLHCSLCFSMRLFCLLQLSVALHRIPREKRTPRPSVILITWFIRLGQISILSLDCCKYFVPKKGEFKVVFPSSCATQVSHSKFSGNPPPTVFGNLSMPGTLLCYSFPGQSPIPSSSSLHLCFVTSSQWHVPLFAGYLSLPWCPDEASFPPPHLAPPPTPRFSQPLINIPCSLPVSAGATEQEVAWSSL